MVYYNFDEMIKTPAGRAKMKQIRDRDAARAAAGGESFNDAIPNDGRTGKYKAPMSSFKNGSMVTWGSGSNKPMAPPKVMPKIIPPSVHQVAPAVANKVVRPMQDASGWGKVMPKISSPEGVKAFRTDVRRRPPGVR